MVVSLSIFLFSCSPVKKRFKTGDCTPERKFHETEPGRISYLRCGDSAGRKIVFIHGTPGSADDMEDFLKFPFIGTEIISVDRPGFGESENTGPVLSLRKQGEMIYPVIRATGNKKTILVGHSLGGALAARIAMDYPSEIGALIFVGASIDPGLEEIMFIQKIGKPFGFILPVFLHNTNLELFALKKDLEEMQRDWKKIRIPVIMIHGSKDYLVPVENVDFAKKMISSEFLRARVYPGVNHFIPWEQPEIIEDAIREILSETEDLDRKR